MLQAKKLFSYPHLISYESPSPTLVVCKSILKISPSSSVDCNETKLQPMRVIVNDYSDYYKKPESKVFKFNPSSKLSIKPGMQSIKVNKKLRINLKEHRLARQASFASSLRQDSLRIV